MESLEEEDEEQEQEQDEPTKMKKKAVKRGPSGLWKQDLVDLVDIVATNYYYQTNLIFVNTNNQLNGKQQIEKQGRGQGE